MSASVLDMGPQIIEGLHHPSSSQAESGENEGQGNDAREEVEKEKEPEENMDPKVNAAKMGMYGPLTREVIPWVPARLLCKRFGVREPDVNLESTEVAKPGQSSEMSMVPSASSSSVVASAGRLSGRCGRDEDRARRSSGHNEPRSWGGRDARA
jgi:G patch domain-containing protein 1